MSRTQRDEAGSGGSGQTQRRMCTHVHSYMLMCTHTHTHTHTHRHNTVDPCSPASTARLQLEEFPCVSLWAPPHSHLPPLWTLQADLAELCLEMRKMPLSVFKYLGLAKDQRIFLFKVCIIWGQFDPYVSDSLALKSSKYWFLRAIWCLRNLFNKLLKLFKPRDWSRCQGPGWLLAGRSPSPGLWLLGAESHAPAAGLTSVWTPCLPQN